jgi:hypothetical protein
MYFQSILVWPDGSFNFWFVRTKCTSTFSTVHTLVSCLVSSILIAFGFVVQTCLLVSTSAPCLEWYFLKQLFLLHAVFVNYYIWATSPKMHYYTEDLSVILIMLLAEETLNESNPELFHEEVFRGRTLLILMPLGVLVLLGIIQVQ